MKPTPDILTSPIAVFDSGVGGLTVLAALRRWLPAERFLYLGDTARLPYGTKSPETVKRYARQATAKLVDEGVKMLVIACNTASAVAIEELSEAYAPLPVVGVVEPGAEAACEASKTGHVLVIGTESTVAGGAYQRAMSARRPELEIDAVACPLFVALAEEGWADGPIVEAVARRYLELELAGPERSRVDTLVLGCTHFPVLGGVLERVCGVGVTLVDSAQTTARTVAEILGARGLAAPAGSGQLTQFWATDAPERFARVGAVFLGRPMDPGQVELVDL